jgi:hypothetical protein
MAGPDPGRAGQRVLAAMILHCPCCAACGTEPIAARCACCDRAACRRCDLCPGCGVVICEACNTVPSPTFPCLGGQYDHPQIDRRGGLAA